MGRSPGGSGAVGNGMVSEGDGGMGGPGWVATGVVGCFGMRVPAAQVFQDLADDGGLVEKLFQAAIMRKEMRKEIMDRNKQITSSIPDYNSDITDN